MDFQLLAVILAVALATVYLGRATWRTWFGASKACGGCASGGCAAPEPKPSVTLISELTVRRRTN